VTPANRDEVTTTDTAGAGAWRPEAVQQRVRRVLQKRSEVGTSESPPLVLSGGHRGQGAGDITQGSRSP